MTSVRTWLIPAMTIVVTALISGSPTPAAPPPLIEVQLDKSTMLGKVVANNEQSFWLLGQDGRLRSVASEKVKKTRQVAPRFSGWTPTTVRDQLRKEFGKAFEVVGTRHYVVCARSEKKARTFAESFEELFRSFQMYFSVRGFKITDPEFPLVAVVFPDYESFARYARSDNVTVSKTLKGYYLTTSNRIALYEDPEAAAAQQSSFLRPSGLALANRREPCAQLPFEPTFALESAPGAWGAIEASLKDTMIHEATHQAAFNTGLHSRIGENPKWVVEGLATVFEAPGVRNSGAAGTAKTRINRERFLWFGNFAHSRRKPKSLEARLANDSLFSSDALDAYSEAWAFTFFLIETRPRAYAEYLRTIATRNPLEAYPADARVADFKKTVSRDLPLLEAEFLRFVASIK